VARFVELIFRANNRAAIRSLNEVATASERTARAAERSFRRQQRAIMATGSAVTSLGRTMTTLGVGMAAFGYVSAKQAVNFQTAMMRIHTQAQVPIKDLDKLSAAVLKMGASGSVQYGPTQLANALYHIESVSVGHTIPGLQKTSAAMRVLKVASQGAAVGGSDLEQTTTALMGVMATLHYKANQANQAMGLINATVGAGNMRMSDLVHALGRGVIPAFRNVGLTAQDAFAAIALVADQGTNASSAAAQLATSLHYLAGPSKQARQFLAQLGLPAQKLAMDLSGPKGLYVALSDIQKSLRGMPQWAKGEVLFSLLPGGRGRILQQVLNNLDQYGKKLPAIYKPAVTFQQAQEAQAKTMSGKLHAAWAQIQTDMTKFGTTLLPIIARYLPTFTHELQTIFGWFTNLSSGTKDFLVKMTAVFLIGGPILMGVGRMITLFGKLRDMLFLVRKAGIAAGEGEAAAAAGGGIGGAGAAEAGVAGARGGPWGILAALAGYLGYKTLVSKRHQNQINADASKVFHFIGKATGLNYAGPLINSLLSGNLGGAGNAALHIGASIPSPLSAASAIYNLFGHTGGSVTPKGIRGYASGGLVDNVPAMLQVGEGVLNRTAMSMIGVNGLNSLNSGNLAALFNGMTISSTPIYITLDGRVLARAVVQQTLRKAARGPSSLVGGALVTAGRAPISR